MLPIVCIALLALGCNAQYGGIMSGTKSFAAPMAAPAPQFAAPLPAAPALQTFAAPQTQAYAAPQQTYSAPLQTYAAPQQSYGPVEAAVHSRRTVELRNVAVQQQTYQPQIIEVNSDNLPVQINFRSHSSPVNVQQTHTPLSGSVEHASFQDQPHRLVNEVTKPIIQEVREIIQPYRRVVQEIRPVIEEIHTVVHKGERVAAVVAEPIVQQPLPLKTASYGSGAALAVNQGYKAAKAAKAA
jgi:hypothetical protein